MGDGYLSPWEAMRWFDTPRTTSFSLSATSQSIAAPNVRRVAIIFSYLTATGTALLIPVTGQGTAAGIMLNSTNNNFVIDNATFGPLSQLEWRGSSPSASILNVIEVFLKDWPEKSPYNG